MQVVTSSFDVSPRVSKKGVVMKTARAVSVWLMVLLLMPVVALAQSNGAASHVIPDHVVYWEVFHRVAVYAHRADAAQRQGQDRSNLRQLVRRRAGLDAEHGQMLEQIALQCERDVAATDAKARAIIDKFHADHPYRLQNRSTPPPSAPSELKVLSQQRIDLILSGRERLRSALGEAAFVKFDQEQQEHAQQTTRPLTAVDVGNVPGHKRHVTAH
jgi:hypothetical protein